MIAPQHNQNRSDECHALISMIKYIAPCPPTQLGHAWRVLLRLRIKVSVSLSIHIWKRGGCEVEESPKTILRRYLFDGAFIQKEDKNKNQRS